MKQGSFSDLHQISGFPYGISSMGKFLTWFSMDMLSESRYLKIRTENITPFFNKNGVIIDFISLFQLFPPLRNIPRFSGRGMALICSYLK